MIKDITLFILLAVGALGLQILVSIFGGIFHSSSLLANRELMRKISLYSVIFSFTIFLVIGFSLVPIFVKLFTDALPNVIVGSDFPKIIKENAWYLVYAFWAVYLIGLGIALPSILKSDFFHPQLPPPPDKSDQP